MKIIEDRSRWTMIECLESRTLAHGAISMSPTVAALSLNRSSIMASSAAAAKTSTSAVKLSSWSSAASGPTSRGDAATATVNGKMYVFGGLTDTSVIPKNDSVDVYDPKANKWSHNVAHLPAKLSHIATAVDGNYVYLAGGVEGTSSTHRVEAIKNVWRFDTESLSFTAMASLPVERSMGEMVILNHQLHYFGGQGLDPEVARSEHYVLDLDQPTSWKTSTPLPSGRKRFGGVAAGGKIYAIGGHTGEDNRVIKNQVWVWDPANPSEWKSLASLPAARSHMPQAIVADPYGGIIIAGGKSSSTSAIKDVTRYDIAANKWTALQSLPTGLNSGLLALIGDQLIFSTGSVGGASFQKVTYRATLQLDD